MPLTISDRPKSSLPNFGPISHRFRDRPMTAYSNRTLFNPNFENALDR